MSPDRKTQRPCWAGELGAERVKANQFMDAVAAFATHLPRCVEFTVDRTREGLRVLMWLDATAPAAWIDAPDIFTSWDTGSGPGVARWVTAFEAFNRRALRVAEVLPGQSRAQIPPGAVWLG